MTCDQANDLIDAHADGSLDAGVGQELDRHLAACPVCTARLRHLRDLLAQSRSLPRSIEPPGDLWTGIDARLRKTARRRTTYALPAWLMAAAAAALILGSSSLTFLLLRTQAGPAGAYGTVPGSLAALERDYTGAVAEIERVLQANRDAMPPEALAAVERSLRVL
ncbi:MAG TPA: zf-HC2 domain-containing protein, partial [Gemmatimonadales bacterium]|nr:zf-HC2 domain-containing protein [Gemmatimonadales bacterium]